MCGSGTVQVINNNGKLGLPWICCSIYNPHLAPAPSLVRQPGEIRAPFTALAWGFICNQDAGIKRHTSRMAGAGQRLILPIAEALAGCLGCGLGSNSWGFYVV